MHKPKKSRKKISKKPVKPTLNSGLLNNRMVIRFLPYILLIVLTYVSFSTILNNDFVSLDDNRFIIENELIRNIDRQGLHDIFIAMDYSPFYKPLVFLSWAIEYHFWGLNPKVVHLNNLLLHILNTILLYVIVLKVLKRLFTPGDRNEIFAFFIALLWAIHPLKVESVAWAVERKDVLYSLFFFTSLLCYLKYLDRKKYVYLLLGAVLYFVGILSKSMIFTLPLILFIPDFLFKRRMNYKIFVEKIPYLIIMIAGLYIYGLIQEFDYYSAGVSSGMIEAQFEGEEVTDHLFFSENPVLRKSIFVSYRLVTWLGRIIYPHDLSAIYPVPEFLGKNALPAGLLIYPLALLIIAAITLYSLKYTRVIMSGLLFSVLAVAPVLGMRGHVTSLINDRYTYMASAGIIFIFVMGMRWFSKKNPKFRIPVFLIVMVLSIVFMLNTSQQCKVWKNSFTLWNHVVKNYPDLAQGYLFRGNTLFRVGNFELAMKDYNYAIRLEPENAEFYRNRGSTKDNMKDHEGAIEDFSKAIELFPNYAAAYMDRGGALASSKNRNLPAAIEDVTRAIEIAPEYWEAYYRRAILLRMMGEHERAILDLNVCADKVRANDRVYLYRGSSRNELGLRKEACDDWKKSKAMGNSQAANMVKRYCE